MMSLSPQNSEDPFDRAVRTHRISLTALVAVVAQAIGVIIWLVQLGADVKQLRIDVTTYQTNNSNLEKEIRTLEVVRDRQASVLSTNSAQEQRLNELNTKLIAMETTHSKMQTQIDLLNAIMKRSDDQQLRIIQALDNTYNLLNEHLRIDHISGGGSRTVNPPLRLPPP